VCLLADEPLRNISPIDAEEILRVLLELARAGCAVAIWATRCRLLAAQTHHLVYVRTTTRWVPRSWPGPTSGSCEIFGRAAADDRPATFGDPRHDDVVVFRMPLEPGCHEWAFHDDVFTGLPSLVQPVLRQSLTEALTT
jgi:hypothetical protein